MGKHPPPEGVGLSTSFLGRAIAGDLVAWQGLCPGGWLGAAQLIPGSPGQKLRVLFCSPALSAPWGFAWSLPRLVIFSHSNPLSFFFFFSPSRSVLTARLREEEYFLCRANCHVQICNVIQLCGIAVSWRNSSTGAAH